MSTVTTHAPPLDRWLAERIGVPTGAITREVVNQYHLRSLQQTIRHARMHSPFYARHLAHLSPDLPRTLEDLRFFPFTSERDLASHDHEFLSESQSRVIRVVTLRSSGTGGTRKRIFFTAADQELALDFFAHGVLAILAPGDRMLIALPSERDGGVGRLLARGIERSGIEPILHGLPINIEATLDVCEDRHPTCLIGFPVHMLALARHPHAARALSSVRFFVLCSDSVSPSLIAALRAVTGADIFEHYGTTEMGLGGGVDCGAHAGYHMREADLYFEVVSTQTGEVLPDGEVGELVFTTLNREAMPLIRYRTGDLSRFVPRTCLCGSLLRRLERIRNRTCGFIEIGEGATLTMPMFDDALFELAGLRDFRVCLRRGAQERLEVILDAPGCGTELLQHAERALLSLPAIAANRAAGILQLCLSLAPGPLPVSDAKRRIEVCCEH